METVLTEKKMKWALYRYSSCSEAMLTLLNQMAGTEWKEVEEASDPLQGGILCDLDAACGILWGAGLAAGVRAQKKISDHIIARNAALYATQKMIHAYYQQEGRVNCTDIINMEKWNFSIYMLKGNSFRCHNNIARWALRFSEVINSSLAESSEDLTSQTQQNCACDAMEKVGQAIGLDVSPYATIPAGLAGGLGLSGNACGALASAIFTQCLKYFISRNKPRHSMIRSLLQGYSIGTPWMNPSRKLNEEFKHQFGTRACRDITKKVFSKSSDLSAFLKEGGCSNVIDSLTKLAVKHQTV